MQFCRPLKGLARSPMAVIEPKIEDFVEWDNWARHQLMSTGSDLFSKFTNIQVGPNNFRIDVLIDVHTIYTHMYIRA